MRSQLEEISGTWRKVFLTMAGVVTLATPVVVSALTAPRLRAQAPESQSAPPADRPAFDVVSVKLNKSVSQGGNLGSLAQPGGLYRASNAPLRLLIAAAYLRLFTKSRLIVGGPGWIDTERFDIEARAAGNPGVEQKRLMMQLLLEDRFKLLMHHETRQLPIYALVVSKPGKTGPQLTPHSDDAKCADAAAGSPPQPGPGETTPAYCGGFFMIPKSGALREAGNNITMDMLGAQLNQSVDRTVVNRTGLSGAFDFTIEFAPELGPGSQPGSNASPSDPLGPPSRFTALQEQLGLKLESQTGPVDVLVIDHVEEPSAN
jgi:uncharacterized protein (TIGR03435 family)